MLDVASSLFIHIRPKKSKMRQAGFALLLADCGNRRQPEQFSQIQTNEYLVPRATTSNCLDASPNMSAYGECGEVSPSWSKLMLCNRRQNLC